MLEIIGVIENIPEIKNLDILKGIPYLNLATQLFEGIITTFGRNADDHRFENSLYFGPRPLTARSTPN